MSTQSEQLAYEYQLGALIDSFGWHRSWLKAYIFLSLLCLPFALLFSLFIIGLPLLIFFLFTIYRSIRRLYSGKVLFVYEHGLIDQRKRRASVVRYSDILSMRTYIAKQYLKGVVYLWTNYIYTLELKDGSKLVVNHSIQNIAHLGTLLGDKLVEAKLPGAIALFQSGQPLQFGKLTVTQTGLSIGKKQLPWSEVGMVTVVPSEYLPALSIYSTATDRQGNLKRWNWLQLNAVTNLPLLLALVDWVRGVSSGESYSASEAYVEGCSASDSDRSAFSSDGVY